MRAAVFHEPGTPLSIESVDDPTPGTGQVVIAVKRCGICGTDLHATEEHDGLLVPGTVMGHEFAGEIVDLGKNVTELKLGQRVSGEGHLIGKHSRQSRAGKFHLDPETRGIGVNEQGAFAEYLRLPAFNAVPLPDAIDDEIGAILDPLGNAVHTALSFDLVGEDVLITGAGPIGIMAAAVARHVGARHIVVTDINPDRLALAKKVADVETVNVAEEDLNERMASLGMKEGFDIGLEMSGSQRALDQMVEALVMGGRIALLGIPPGKSPVDWSRIVFKAITIKGVYGREIFETWYKMIAMLENGLDIRNVITHRMHVDAFKQGFETMKSGASGKIVLDWTAS